MSAIPNTPFLRTVLYADAAMGAAAAALTIAGSGFLSSLLALPAGLIFWAGVALVPVALFLFVMARADEVPRSWLTEIVAINALWVMASFAILFSGWVQPNLLGTLFIVAQAGAVALFAVLEAGALRSGRAVAARA